MWVLGVGLTLSRTARAFLPAAHETGWAAVPDPFPAGAASPIT